MDTTHEPRIPTQKGIVVYSCTSCEFASLDGQEARQHIEDANRHVGNRWWRHELTEIAKMSSKAEGSS
jgi:hypothetical protein